MTDLFKKLTKPMSLTTPEAKAIQPEKQYLVIITWSDGDRYGEEFEARSWKVVFTRAEVIRLIVAYRDDLDLDESYVCSETVQANKAWHLYTFARFCAEEGVWDETLDSELGFSFDEFEQMILEDYEISQEELDEVYMEEVNM